MKLALLLVALPLFGQQYQKIAFPVQAASGTTISLAVPFAPTKHGVMSVVTGGPATCSVQLEGSMDNTNFFLISASTTCTSTVMFQAIDKPVLYVRINLTALTGGTAPTVTSTYLGTR